MNATSKCEGRITRERNTTRGAEKAILDFFIVCEKMFPLVSKMVIDEKGEKDLVRYKGEQIVKADHNMLKLELNINIHEKKDHNRIEMFNMRNKICQKQFKEFTTNTNRFTKCFPPVNLLIFSSKGGRDSFRNLFMLISEKFAIKWMLLVI